MAGFSLLALLDDITAILDDVAAMSKVAATKTAGVLGDDLALNAQQVSGVQTERELPVVWAVAKGSMVNKAILIPAALLISAVVPKLITPLLMIGGAYLCFEGAEKLAHKFLHKKAHEGKGQPDSSGFSIDENAGERADALSEEHMLELEKKKISGAVRTDFILSAEIIVIALGTVPKDASLLVQAGVLVMIGLLMTVGVYGLVGGIVKLDDWGLWLLKKSDGRGIKQKIGAMLVGAAPFLMRLLGVLGTAAMFMVGGSILAHGLSFTQHVFEFLGSLPVAWLWSAFFNAIVGIIAGLILLAATGAAQALKRAVGNGGPYS